MLLLLACAPKPVDTGTTDTDTAPHSAVDTALDCGEIAPGTWYADWDGDGAGDPGAPIVACEKPTGAVTNADDCDDADASVQAESPYYLDRDADTFGDPTTGQASCHPPAGRLADATDCDDTRAEVHPGATEVCDTTDTAPDRALDNDCDGFVDEVDPDWDATTGTLFYADADRDGYYGATTTLLTCVLPEAAYSATWDDCDDTDETVNPGAPEVCNNHRDDDCDGGASACGIVAGDVEPQGLAFTGPAGTGAAVLLVDTTGDGRADAFAAAPEDGGGTLYGRDDLARAGSFEDGTTWTGGDGVRLGASLVRVGDTTTDGYEDLAVAGPGYADGAGYAWLYRGAASMGAMSSSGLYGSTAGNGCGEALGGGADASGDGLPDWVVGCPGYDGGFVVLATGARNYYVTTTADDASLGRAVELEDLDGDGTAELVVGRSGAILAFLGPLVGSTSETSADDEAAIEATGLVGVGDVSGDGYGDVVVLDGWIVPGAAAHVLSSTPFDLGGAAASADAGDFDGDGALDLAVGTAGATYVLPGPITGDLDLPGATTLTSSSTTLGGPLAAGDADADGFDDLLLGAPSDGVAWLLLGGAE